MPPPRREASAAIANSPRRPFQPARWLLYIPNTLPPLTREDRDGMDATMTEPSPAAPDLSTQPAKPKKKEDNFFVFLIKLILIVVVFRSFIFAPFSIPSESMLPRLMNGDYLLAAKWPYGFSHYSLPWSAPLLPEHR